MVVKEDLVLLWKVCTFFFPTENVFLYYLCNENSISTCDFFFFIKETDLVPHISVLRLGAIST